jgi:RES domain-containing protein
LVVWRIYDHRAAWASRPDANPLSGEGGLHGPGRWHHRGTRVVYTAQSASLAVLETLVRVPPQLFGERTLLELEVPDDLLEDVGPTQMFRFVHDAPADDPERLTRDHGRAWVDEARSLGLRVPSAVMPMERHIVLNPAHPDMHLVVDRSREVIRLDPRLFPNPDQD